MKWAEGEQGERHEGSFCGATFRPGCHHPVCAQGPAHPQDDDLPVEKSAPKKILHASHLAHLRPTEKEYRKRRPAASGSVAGEDAILYLKASPGVAQVRMARNEERGERQENRLCAPICRL